MVSLGLPLELSLALGLVLGLSLGLGLPLGLSLVLGLPLGLSLGLSLGLGLVVGLSLTLALVLALSLTLALRLVDAVGDLDPDLDLDRDLVTVNVRDLVGVTDWDGDLAPHTQSGTAHALSSSDNATTATNTEARHTWCRRRDWMSWTVT